LIFTGLLVVSVLLVPVASTSGTGRGRNHQKRVAAETAAAAGGILATGITTVVTDALTKSPNLITDIFKVVTDGIDLGFASAVPSQSGSTLNNQIDALLTAIGKLVNDAVNGNMGSLNADINAIICDAEQIGGIAASKCTTQTLETTIAQLVTDAKNPTVTAATIVTDAFAIVTSALDLAAQISGSSLTPVIKLINAICTLVVTCVNGNVLGLSTAIQGIVTAAMAL